MNTVLIVDDHDIVRTGLRYILKDMYPSVKVLESKDGTEAMAWLEKQKISCVILDVQLPDKSSIGLAEYLRVHFPSVHVLVFTMSPEKLFGARFIKAGAKGYLSKSAPVEEVKKALDAVMRGKRYISAGLMHTLVEEFSREPLDNPFAGLSNRELAVTNRLLAGAPTSEIAHQLHLQPSSVTTYKSRIFRKLRVSNLIELKELASIYNIPC